MPAQEVLLVTGSYDRNIRFWEAWSGICSRTIDRAATGELWQVNKLAISPDKKWLAAAIHKKVNIYHVPGTSDTPTQTIDGHSMNITALKFNSEGKWMVTGSEDGTIRIWDASKHYALHRRYENGSPVNDVCVHPNQGELISCDQAGRIRVWDLSNPDSSPAVELAPSDVPIRSVSIAANGQCLAAGDNNGQVYIWGISEGTFELVGNFRAHQKYLTHLVISPDSKSLATCSADTTVRIWTILPNLEVRLNKVLLGHARWVWDAVFSADSAYLVTASSDHMARLWEVATGESVRQYNGHTRAAVCCALHDGEG